MLNSNGEQDIVLSSALVFPGQGSQKLGMLSDYYAAYSQVKQLIEEANDTLNFNLWGIMQSDEIKLNQTEYTQPALLAASVAIYRILSSFDIQKPVVMAGHSLGEYSALVCSGALSFQDALKLVHLRGCFMAEAVPLGVGAMSFILGLEDQLVEEIVQSQSIKALGIVQCANYNSPGQIVISGVREAVEQVNVLAKEKGAKRAQMLPVSVPSHCDLMRPAAEKFQEEINKVEFLSPVIPVIQNVDVQCHQGGDRIRSLLVQQLYSSVRWVETVQKIIEFPVSHIVECGAGKVLTGLNKRIDVCKRIVHLETSTLIGLNKIEEEIFCGH